MRETTSLRSVLPAGLALVAVCVLVAVRLAGPGLDSLRDIAVPLAAILGLGAAIGGVLSRSRISTLIGFNAAAAVLSSLGIATIYALHDMAALGPGVGLGPGVALGLLAVAAFIAFCFSLPFFVVQVGAALLGRGLRRVVVGR